MARKQQAFTLIELMVVVAIIAILATLSVSNFSTAIRRTRNTQRISDITTVAKAMETCYDVMKGTYQINEDIAWTTFDADDDAEGPFLRGSGEKENNCLNESIVPSVSGYLYGYQVIKQTSAHPAAFKLCARLEQVDGWESVGNTEKPDDVTQLDVTKNFAWDYTSTCKTVADGGTECWFCTVNSQ